MAILKHIASKNADYSAALEYLLFQHNEKTQQPILDGNGKKIMREEYYMDGINCDPFTFDIECEKLNARYHKNQKKADIKSHHYIISFDPADRDECALTGERAQALGMEYVRKNFPGHQALVCTHTDGHNGSGNIHVHIVINSLRKLDIEEQPFTERLCDTKAGNKHHVTNKYLAYIKQSLMDLCNREQLHQVDLLSPSEKKISEKEYWAQRRGQDKLDELNKQIIADGLTPRTTVFQTQKQFLRDAIDEISKSAVSFEEFTAQLKEKYGITVTDKRGRFSYLHPERNKNITSRALGTNYDKQHLMELFEQNALSHSKVKKKPTLLQNEQIGASDTFPQDDYIPILFIRSDLRLVVDLQNSIKEQQSRAYAQKVKLTNLQEMAKTVAYVQEHGYDTEDNLTSAYDDVTAKLSNARATVKATEAEIKSVNEQIHYTGQYFSHKAVHAQFLKAKNKGKFRKEHSTELTLYDEAVKFLKAKNNGTQIPSIKALNAEKERLTTQKSAQYETYQYFKDYQKELRTVCSNVDSILDRPKAQQRDKQKSQDIS